MLDSGIKETPNNFILLSYLLIGICFFAYLMKIVSFYSKYEHSKEYIGEVKFSTNHIKWKDDTIEWISLKSISINFDEIEGKLDIGETTTKNNVSDGINRIEIVTKNNLKYYGWYLISNLEQAKHLKYILNETVFINNLEYDLAKLILKPSNYKEHQELKKKLNKKTDNF